MDTVFKQEISLKKISSGIQRMTHKKSCCIRRCLVCTVRTGVCSKLLCNVNASDKQFVRKTDDLLTELFQQHSHPRQLGLVRDSQ